MHFEILVEDRSGKKALDILSPRIIDAQDSFKVRAYKGIGRIPKNLTSSANAGTHLLPDQLPKVLRGYGKTCANYAGAVIVVCDLDSRCLKAFRKELFAALNACNPKPETRFCIAMEEGEAWLSGDIPTLKTAYPNAKDAVLTSYTNDSICGTWELLADAVHRGGARALQKRRWYEIGREKSKWVKDIAPLMDIDRNASHSFRYLRDKLRELSQGHTQSIAEVRGLVMEINWRNGYHL